MKVIAMISLISKNLYKNRTFTLKLGISSEIHTKTLNWSLFKNAGVNSTKVLITRLSKQSLNLTRLTKSQFKATTQKANKMKKKPRKQS